MLGQTNVRRRAVIVLCILRSSLCTGIKPTVVQVRIARRGDINCIKSINELTLPENYSEQFYNHQLFNWPHLALVAEHVFDQGSPTPQRKAEVIGYVLGRIDGLVPLEKGEVRQKDAGTGGHVTSLAVLPTWRKQGIAVKLMVTLHQRMTKHHSAKSSSLHVRVSNDAAVRLYRDLLGYEIMKVVEGYYQDGENAYFMVADLTREVEKVVQPVIVKKIEEVPLPKLILNPAVNVAERFISTLRVPSGGGSKGLGPPAGWQKAV